MTDLCITPIVCGMYQANAYLLYGASRSDALLIDPGDGYAALKAALDKSGRRLTDILLTHGHFDHFLCAARLAREYGAHIHIHPMDAYLLSSQADSAWNASVCEQPFTPVVPDAPYEGEMLQACGISFRVIHTPGHTRGGVCLLHEESGSLFTGDTLFAQGYGRYDLPGGDVNQLAASLRNILKMDPRLTVYPGHGEGANLGQIAGGYRL